jgi:hypothetical protein
MREPLIYIIEDFLLILIYLLGMAGLTANAFLERVVHMSATLSAEVLVVHIALEAAPLVIQHICCTAADVALSFLNTYDFNHSCYHLWINHM